MNKRYLNYTIAGVSIGIASFVIIQLTSIEKVQSKVPKTSQQSLNPESVQKPVKPIAKSTEIHSEDEEKHSEEEANDKHAGHNHDFEFFTEMMPHTQNQDIAANTISIPKNDNDRLGYILDAEFAPAMDAVGEFSGLKISGLPESLSGTLPLPIQNGDVVTQINNTKIVDENSFGVAIERLYNTGKDSGSIIFEVDRDGAAHTVALHIDP